MTAWTSWQHWCQHQKQHRAALLDRIVAAADISTAQDISNCMYGLALLQQPPTRKQHQQLATAVQRMTHRRLDRYA